MNRTAAELQKAFDDLMAEKVSLEAEAETRDKKVAEVLKIWDSLPTEELSARSWSRVCEAMQILQDLDA